jgi:hypothetical protein
MATATVIFYASLRYVCGLCALKEFADLRKNTEITEYVRRVIFLTAVLPYWHVLNNILLNFTKCF